MSHLYAAWMSVTTITVPGDGDDPIPIARWSASDPALLVIRMGEEGSLFVPKVHVPEFLRRVQAAVEEGLHTNPQVMTEFGPVEDVTMEVAERSAA